MLLSCKLLHAHSQLCAYAAAGVMHAVRQGYLKNMYFGIAQDAAATHLLEVRTANLCNVANFLALAAVLCQLAWFTCAMACERSHQHVSWHCT
jgi:hypothetical protein